MKKQKKPDFDVAGYGGSDYFCNVLHIEQVSDKLAGNSGYFLYPDDNHTVPTPVRMVNASATCSRCKTTGKRDRFCFSAIINVLMSYIMSNQTTTLSTGKARTSATAAIREWMRRENRTATRLMRGISDRTVTNAEVLRDVNAALSLTTLLVVAESGSIAVITLTLAWCALSLIQLKKGGEL